MAAYKRRPCKAQVALAWTPGPAVLLQYLQGRHTPLLPIDGCLCSNLVYRLERSRLEQAPSHLFKFVARLIVQSAIQLYYMAMPLLSAKM